MSDLGSLVRAEINRQEAAHIEKGRVFALALMNGTSGASVVYPWDNAPECFKQLSTNGGDEDFVIVHVGECGAYWSHNLAVCDEDTLDLGVDFHGKNIHVTITYHS